MNPNTIRKRAKNILLCLFFCFCMGIPLLLAQSTTISLNVKDKTLKEVIKQIEAEGGYIFLYDGSIDLDRRITINMQNSSLDAILDRILDARTEYRIENRQVVLYLRGQKPANESETPPQNRFSVHGTVKDTHGNPLIGASVIELGTTNGQITDQNGEYSIEVANRKSMLQFTFLGYKTVTRPAIYDRMDIVLEDNSAIIDDIVVIGYGTQTKASVTGALSTINTKDLVKAPVASITNVLAGSVPGITTVQTTGQPGSDAAAIYIRGVGSLSDNTSTPLILVDGVERDFSQIDPNEIENFSILKDAASTAVFGVRGANGVILITTKRGQEGKASISVSSNTGIQQPISYVEQTGSYEYARFWNIKQQNDRVNDPSQYFTKEALEAYRTGSDPIMYPNKKWRDEIFNKVFLQTKNNINISGGNKDIRYFVSLGYLFQNGMLKQTDYLDYDNNFKYNRYNYRANLDFNFTPTTTFKLGIGGHVGRTQEPRTRADGNAWIYAGIWTVPMAGPGFINGIRTVIPSGFVPSKIELRDGWSTFFGHGYDQHYNTTLNLDAELTQKLDLLTNGLSVSIKGAFDNRFNLTKMRPMWDGAKYQTVYYKSYLEDRNKPQSDPDYDRTYVFVPSGSVRPIGYGDTNYGRDRNWYLEARIDYSRTFGSSNDHKVTALLLYNQSRDYYPTAGGGSYQYIPRSYVGYVSRITYGFQNKYLVDLNVGYNGSENFAPGKSRYGVFPSASVGWIMSEEAFMQNQNTVNYLKFRVSWGRVGNDQTNARFLYMPGVWVSDNSYSFGIDNPQNTEAYALNTPGNSDVTWETADKQNYGIDANFLNNRLAMTFDYFFEHRTGILLTPNTTPAIIATALPPLNIGVVDNHGYELSLGWNNTTPRGFNYYINANLSYARNKIIYMDEVYKDYPYQYMTGGPTGRYSGIYKFLRLYQESDFTTDADDNLKLNSTLPQPTIQVMPGDAMYADLNNDNRVDTNDTMVTGYSTRPEYVFGINAGFNYKGFNLTMQWTGATHVNRMLEVEYRVPYTNAGGRGLLQYFYDNCWTPGNPNGSLPRAAESSEVWNSEPSTLWLRDSKYLRLKTLTIGYTFNSSPRLKAIGMKALGITLSGYNLVTFTPLDIIDPEMMPNINGAYPLVKVYSLGLNITF